jgi:hypothetical protein
VVVIWIEEYESRGGREPGSLENFGQVIDQCARSQLGDFGDFSLTGVEKMQGQVGKQSRLDPVCRCFAQVRFVTKNGELSFMAYDNEIFLRRGNEVGAAWEKGRLPDLLAVGKALNTRPEIVAATGESCGFDGGFIDCEAWFREAIELESGGAEGFVVADDRIIEIEGDHAISAAIRRERLAVSSPQ